MKYIVTSATQYLAPLLTIESVKYTNIHFSDGELYIHLEEDVADQNIVVIAATRTPAEHILELLFLLDALQRNNAYIFLLFTYFGYARQDRASLGEALSAQVISTIIKNSAQIRHIDIIHVHSQQLHTFLPFTNHIPIDFFVECARSVDIIVAPDQGAHLLAQEISTITKKEAAYITKRRPQPEEVEVTNLEGAVVARKKVLIVDDMISTGNTIVHAAELLKQQGAERIDVAVTHGIFTHHAIKLIEESCIDHLLVTNTVAQHHQSQKISMVSIAPLLERIIHSYEISQ